MVHLKSDQMTDKRLQHHCQCQLAIVSPAIFSCSRQITRSNNFFPMRQRTGFRIGLLVVFIAILLGLTDHQAIDPFDQNPRIFIEDGHIIFQTAANKNIKFLSTGGSVLVNGEDLSRITQLGRSAVQDLQQASGSRLNRLASSIDAMQEQLTAMSNSVANLVRSQDAMDELSSKMRQLFGEGSTAITPQRIRRTIRRVDRLRNRVNRLTQLLSQNECASNPCLNGGSCIDTFNGFICRCTTNWEGVACESDVNECQRFAGTELGCQNGGTCTNTPGSFSCQCPANWFGVHCTEQHDDCASASNEALCVHGTCVNQPRRTPGQANYRCICDQGWTSRSSGSPACDVDIDECSATRPHCSTNPSVTCINLPGTFFCGPCPPGFTGNGYYCDDVDECQTNNGGCSINPMVQCTNTRGSRRCGPCPAGYVGDGFTCTFAGVCRVSNGGCHPMATCIENAAISASFRECRCPPGYIGTGVGPNGCLPTGQVPPSGQTPVFSNACASNPCVHGTCLPNGESFACVCFPGFAGSRCQTTVNQCQPNPCRNGGTCVESQPNGFRCTCPSSFQGPTCERTRESCGGRFNNMAGSVRYPNSPNTRYPDRVNCAWTITTASGQVLKLNFSRFHLERSSDCAYDFLQINDGPNANAQSLGRFCGDQLPLGGEITTTHNQVYLWFKSDHSVSGDGFEFQWNTTRPVCGGQLNITDYGSVNSPGYPGNYPHDRDCFWVVKVPLGKRIQFHFATLAIEQHATCQFDFVEIFDGPTDRDPLLQRYCNSTTPAPITTSGPRAVIHFHSDGSFTDRGFHITFASVPGIQGCGGSLTSPRGQLSSPNFPDRYDNNVECDWLIRVHPLDRIQLSFSTFDLEQHSRCRWDYVEVRDGEDQNSPLIGRFCGQQMPLNVTSSGNKMWVKFRADSSFTGRGFRADYSAACGGVFTDPSGQIKSPYFPDPYPNSRQCVYQIIVPVGNIITLAFDYFDVEGGSSCFYDYLEIRDTHDNGTQLGRLCGHHLPDPITTTYNQLWMKFVTDGSVSNRGFMANYSSQDVGCGGVLITNHGSLATPNHPNFYPNGANCSWLLRAPIGFVIRLTFTVFNVETHPNCQFDFVEVKDSNGARIGRFCGSSTPPVLTSTENQMTVVFSSDQNRVHEGFAAAYSFLDAANTCGGNLFAESGVIRSPGFPREYPAERDCRWRIQVSSGRQIRLNVTRFDIERGGTSCIYDFVELRNGGSDNSPLIGQYCGTTIPRTIVSHSHLMWIRFKSDRSMSGTGFEILYDGAATGCGGTVSAPTSSIESPGYPQPYGHNIECGWSVRVSTGSVITINLVDIDMERHSNCQFDYVEIFDGADERAPTLGKFCRSEQQTQLISRSNRMYVKFRSDASDSGRGFRLTFQTRCNNLVSGLRGVIESPNFPDPYPHNANCSWTIQAPLGNNISMAFSGIFLEHGTDCLFDYIQVSELMRFNSSLKPLKRFCGTPQQLPPPIKTDENVAVVNFVTDQSISYAGFRLEWLAIGCGGEFVNKNWGEMQTPNYPNGYQHLLECIWHITAPPQTTIQLDVVEVDIEASENCQFDYVKVFGGPDETSPLLWTGCNRLNDQKVSSTGRSMTVKFFADNSFNGRGFFARFQTQSGGCSQSLKAMSGSITSPNFPAPYDAADDCEYQIDVGGLHDIQFTFQDFELPESYNCSSSFIAIYDGPSSSDTLLIKTCGTRKPAQVRTSSNKAYIRFKADGSSTRKGFQLKYQAICGGRRILTDGQIGQLESPNYPHASVEHSSCQWTLVTAQPDRHITLIFTHLNAYDGNCSTSYIEVRDGDDPNAPLVSRFCGHRIPAPIVSQSNALTIIQPSYFEIFRATFSSASSFCGGNLTSYEGFFTSPDYPNSYPSNIECVWTIAASPGNRVSFGFTSFDVEQSDFCNSDYLELREQDSGGPLLGRFCGNEIPDLNNLTSTNRLWIKFRSDQLGSGRGFTAHYALVHGVELSGGRGRIASPGYPLNVILPGYGQQIAPQTFTWTVMVPTERSVTITFLTFSIATPYETGDCASYLQILNGYGLEAPEVGRFCGYRKPDPVTTSSNVATINLVIDSTNAASTDVRFLLEWLAVNQTASTSVERPSTVVQEGNSVEVTLNRTGVYRFQSPGYPNGYAPSLNYNWTITTVQSMHLRVRVVNMLLEGYQNERYSFCYDDYVKFMVPKQFYSSLWHVNTTLCARWSEKVFELPSNVIRINLITSRFYNFTGFDIEVSPVCGGVLRESSGVISTLDTQTNERCNWTIIVREGRTIRLSFDELDMPDCQYTYVMIRNGGYATSPLLGNGRFCGSYSAGVPDSAANSVRVEFVAPHGRHAAFKLVYQEVSIACNDFITLSDVVKSTIIQSPNYPNPPPHDMECGWVIMAPGYATLRFEFVIDRQYPGAGCNLSQEMVAVHDGGSVNSPIIERYCVPPRIIHSIRSSTNFIFVRFASLGVNNMAGFMAKVDINDCGGSYFIDFKYKLKSPNYPRNYTNNIQCEYYLRTFAEDTHYLTISFNVLDLPATQDCSAGDYIEFREANAYGNLLGRFCGQRTNLTNAITSRSGIVYAIFKTDTTRTGTGFTFTIETHYQKCGTTIENAAVPGIITSPKFPFPITKPMSCSWVFLAPPGRRIKLTFLEYRLKRDVRNVTKCLDTLMVSESILDWSDKMNPLPCGGEPPSAYQTLSHHLLLTYITNGTGFGDGFRIRYSAEEEELCGGRIDLPPDATSTTGDIQSYRFGQTNYTEHFTCSWDIVIPDNSSLTFVFDVFEMAKNNNSVVDYNDCYYKNFFVVGYFNTLHHYNHQNYYVCGNKTSPGRPYIYHFPKGSILPNVMSIASVTTNYTNGLRGFRGKYHIRNCGGYFFNPSGEWTSPNYPNNYPTESYCEWVFAVDWGQVVWLTFDDFRLEADCQKDYVEVIDGFGLHSYPTIVGRFCGSQKPNKIISFTSVLHVNFVSDGSGNERGFRMRAETKSKKSCGGHLAHYYGTIESPNYPQRYNDSIECVWFVKMPTGYHVNLTFIDRFDIETHATCDRDYVLFEEQTDRENDVWRRIGKYCGLQRPAQINSKTNYVRVTFHSDERNSFDGFRLRFQLGCGGVSSQPSGVIASPNYPGQYSDYLQCEFLIQRQPNDYVVVSFDDQFGVEKHPTCLWDSIDIFLGNTTEGTAHLGPYCGVGAESKPPTVSSLGAILIRFHTDLVVTSIGFRANYSISSCGGNLTGPGGELTSPFYPTNYKKQSNCFWLITVDPNKVIEFKFSHLDIESCWRCECDYVEFRDGHNASAPLISRFCGHNTENTQIVKSKTNQLFVMFKSDTYFQGTGFRGGFRATLGERQGCGGFFNASSGQIQSPDADNDRKYDEDLDCWWHLVVDSNKIIRINFDRMDIEQSPANMTKCAYDYLEVRDGLQKNSPLVDRFCGNQIPSAIVSAGNQLTIYFHSDSRNSRTGFRLSYTSADPICGGFVRVTNSTQTLTSPNYPNNYATSLRCRWHFMVNSNPGDSFYTWEPIQINFNSLDMDCSNNDFIEFSVDASHHRRLEPYRLCGSQPPPMITSYQGLWMTLVTGSNRPSTPRRGFSLNYQMFMCNQAYSLPDGFIANPGFPNSGFARRCQFNITAPAGNTIAVYFNTVSIGGQDSCGRINMTVRDGLSANSPVLAVLCGDSLPQPIFSTGNGLSMFIDNRPSYGYKYFMTYTTTSAGRGCGGNLTAFNGSFTSPMYPTAFSQAKECRWLIQSMGLHAIELRFDVLSLSSTRGCQTNFVDIFDGADDSQSSKLIRLCGDDNPTTYQSTGSTLLVKLVTSANNTGQGFRARFNYKSLGLTEAASSAITSDIRPYVVSNTGRVYLKSDGILFRNANSN